MSQQPQVRLRYDHREACFDGNRAGLDAAYAFVREAVADAPGAQFVGDVLTILAANAITHSDTGRGGTFRVQLGVFPGSWRLRIDDDGHDGDYPRLIGSERGEPLHGLAALNAARVMWTLPAPGVVLADIECPLPGEEPPDLSQAAKRAATSLP